MTKIIQKRRFVTVGVCNGSQCHSHYSVVHHSHYFQGNDRDFFVHWPMRNGGGNLKKYSVQAMLVGCNLWIMVKYQIKQLKLKKYPKFETYFVDCRVPTMGGLKF